MFHTTELYLAARIVRRAHSHLQIILLQVCNSALIFSHLEGCGIFAEGEGNEHKV